MYNFYNDGIYAAKKYSIAYCYDTSPNADALNDGEGCYYVQVEAQREDGSFFTAPVIDAFPTSSPDDPALLRHLAEWQGEPGNAPPRYLEVL